MADIGAEFVFPNPVDADLTIDSVNGKVRLDPKAELVPFIGRVVLPGPLPEAESLLSEALSGIVRYDKNSPPRGSAIANFSIRDRHLFVLFYPKDKEIPNAFVSPESSGPKGEKEVGDYFLINRAEGEWTFDFNQ
ncbi:hypothetical protein CTheo_8082 [Ceratobasidium theobromae]|uniref:Uncharacterized protein n=1 Tax=Ceratobasidium theobromae TaxID=1582974 RepID=A0A5N5QAM0_9AGAM|nr:hypothetical protein CTheo_8082 [Ceratobasidium theobromae]